MIGECSGIVLSHCDTVYWLADPGKSDNYAVEVAT